MFQKQSDQFESRAIKLLRQPGSVIVPLTISPYSQRDKGRGHFLHLPQSCPIELVPTGGHQYIGIHECMVVTLRRPRYWNTLLKIAKDLPVIKPFGLVTWLGAIAASSWVKTVGATQLYIQRSTWDPEPRMLIRTKGIIHPYVAGRGGFTNYLLEIPAVRRDGVVPEYLENL